ncbi:MAG: response regulator [Anaerolineales bacterium]|nr:response regulator [Anaerolineales bacterium]
MTDSSLALIVEDDPDLAEIFSEALRFGGFQVEALGNGADALQRLKEIVPSVIVLDMHLPGASGVEILRQVRADSRLETTRVIASTADARLAETLEETADLVLVKPISFTQLRDLAVRLKR